MSLVQIIPREVCCYTGGVLLFKCDITRKMVPITGRARSFLLVFKNKIERRGRQNKNNRHINLLNVITFSTDFMYTTHLSYTINILFIYIHTYIHI